MHTTAQALHVVELITGDHALYASGGGGLRVVQLTSRKVWNESIFAESKVV